MWSGATAPAVAWREWRAKLTFSAGNAQGYSLAMQRYAARINRPRQSACPQCCVSTIMAAGRASRCCLAPRRCCDEHCPRGVDAREHSVAVDKTDPRLSRAWEAPLLRWSLDRWPVGPTSCAEDSQRSGLALVDPYATRRSLVGLLRQKRRAAGACGPSVAEAETRTSWVAS